MNAFNFNWSVLGDEKCCLCYVKKRDSAVDQLIVNVQSCV